MSSLLLPIAEALHAVLPEWVRLPSLTFVLPHTVYWLGLLLFPLAAMYLVSRAEAETKKARVSVAISYLLWLWGGIAGLHRFYVRSLVWGALYIVLLMAVLYGNSQGTIARNLQSEANNQFKIADFDVDRFKKALRQGKANAAQNLAKAEKALVEARQGRAEANALFEQWGAFVGGIAAVILILLIIDAFLIPRLTRACADREAAIPPPADFSVMMRGAAGDERMKITTPFIRFADRISGAVGTFVAYWSMVAVFVYYYEVLARYVFNSPTNWAHESMFLMFGMQYLLSGAYALREDAHVRVDVIFERFSIQQRARIDVVTSFFFFVFAITLMLTGALFARDSIAVWEVSFTEWAIQYWPVKITFVLGAALLILQGLAKLTRDILFLQQYRSG
jgi:TRAP-type mannitol/chloroaromatic compound transport system permease small subunit